MSDAVPTDIDLDLRGTVCPMAFVKLRLFADKKSSGSTFRVLYEDTRSNAPLVRSIESVGHKTISHESLMSEADASGPALILMVVQVGG